MNRRDLKAFVEREQDQGLKLSLVKTKLDRVHTFLRFLIEEEVICPEVLVSKKDQAQAASVLAPGHGSGQYQNAPFGC